MSSQLAPHVGFPLSASMQSKSNRFLEAVEAGDKRSGELFYEVLLQLTEEVIDALLVQTITIARMSPMAQKVVHMCAATSNKASSLLSAKIYKGAKQAEMVEVGKFWQKLIRNEGSDAAGNWYLATPIDSKMASALDGILAEKGDATAFAPRDIEDLAAKYEQLMMMIIDEFFLGPAAFVDIGMVTRKMLNLGVDGVKSAAHAVIHKVVKKLDPEPMAAYVNHTTQFYIRLP